MIVVFVLPLWTSENSQGECLYKLHSRPLGDRLLDKVVLRCLGPGIFILEISSYDDDPLAKPLANLRHCIQTTHWAKAFHLNQDRCKCAQKYPQGGAGEHIFGPLDLVIEWCTANLARHGHGVKQQPQFANHLQFGWVTSYFNPTTCFCWPGPVRFSRENDWNSWLCSSIQIIHRWGKETHRLRCRVKIHSSN